MNFEITRYRPELRPGVIALLEHLVSRDGAVNDAYFEWKHETNPYTPEPLAYVALAGGTVVGMRAFQGARWQLGADGETVSWPCACDFVVAPEHRGHKLFRRIMDVAVADLAERGVGRILNWSASPITHGVSLRTGWRLVGTFDACARQSRRARRVRRWAERLGRLPLAWRFAHVPESLFLDPGFGALDAWWAGEAGGATITLEKRARPEAMAEVVRRSRVPRIGHVRDAIYYQWRFGNPLSEYRFVYATDTDLRGFLVLRAARHGDGAGVAIVDWAASSPSLLESLLTRVIECDRFDRLSLWSAAHDAKTTARLGEWGLAPEERLPAFPDYRRGLLALGVRDAGADDADPVAGGWRAAGLDRWDLRPVYSDFY